MGAVGLLAGCGAYDAVVGFFESSDEAAVATTDTMVQLGDTLHTLEHLFLLIPAYIAGEARRPLWGKMKAMRDRKKSKKAKQL